MQFTRQPVLDHGVYDVDVSEMDVEDRATMSLDRAASVLPCIYAALLILSTVPRAVSRESIPTQSYIQAAREKRKCLCATSTEQDY